MSIVVTGTFTLDTNFYLDKPVAESIGGILYNVVALASLTDEIIIPVANVGPELYDRLVAILSLFPNVSLDGLRKVDLPDHHCFLFYVYDYPGEVTVGGVGPIVFKQMAPFLDGASFVLVNMVSGFDLSLSTLKLIKKRVPCPLYLDYHLLGLGKDVLGNRYLRKRSNWVEWMAHASFVQLNEFEATHLWGKPINAGDEAISFGKKVLANGPKAMIITLGAAGSLILYRKGSRVLQQHITTSKIDDIKDTGGCGDTYSAGFISHYLRQEDFITACHQASSYASKKCSVFGPVELARVLNPKLSLGDA